MTAERSTEFHFPPEARAAFVVGEKRYPVERFMLAEHVERVRSDNAVKGDAKWRATDSNGHDHWWIGRRDVANADRGTRHVPCDGTCGGVCQGEGYSVPEWRCSLCGEVIEPKYVPDEQARGIGIPMTVTLDYTVFVRTYDLLPPVMIPGRPVAVEGHIEYEAPDRLVPVGGGEDRPKRYDAELTTVKMPLPRLFLSGDVEYVNGEPPLLSLSGTEYRTPS